MRWQTAVFFLLLRCAELVQQHSISHQNYKQIMSKYLLAVLLLVAVANCYFLSPQYLPTAFTEQYYEVRYRVRGMPHAKLTFTNLPDFLTANENGVVSGTPTITGTFRFNIAYSNEEDSGEEEAVLSVTTSPNTKKSEAQNKEVVELIVTTALNSWIYRSGEHIDFSMTSKGGKAPIVWNCKNLPNGLSSDIHGKVSGSIKEAGLYSFSCGCGDAMGQKASSYYTLNIQPGSLIKTNNIIDVPDRNAGLVYDIEQVEAQQIAADKAVARAMKVVAQNKAFTKAKMSAQAKTQLAFNLAVSQEAAAERSVNKLQAQYDRALEVSHRAEANLGTAKNIVAIAETAVLNAKANLKAAKLALDVAQEAFDRASDKFEEANNAYIKAKNELSQAELDHQNAFGAYKDAEHANNVAWNNVQASKAALDAANDKLLEANQAVANARNNVDLAVQANDDALTQLNIADAALTAAQHTLEDANNAVAALRIEASGLKNKLGVANFNLQQALNNLFVAQAAKAAADKAVSLAYAQGSSLDMLEGESTYIFKGCNEQVYPEITGTVAVSTLVTSGAKLNSGQVLTWGPCTEKTDAIDQGDVVAFEGVIINGVISARKAKVVAKGH